MQAPVHTVAGSTAYGCRLYHIRLQAAHLGGEEVDEPERLLAHLR